MISIFKSATELDRLEALQGATQECLARAVGLAGEHAVEVSATPAAELRRSLRALEKHVRDARAAEEFQAAGNSFQNELRNYHDAAQTEIQNLRKDIEGAAAIVESFAENVAGNGDDYQRNLKRDLKQFEQLAQHEDLQEIRRGIEEVTGRLIEGCEKMHRANQMVVAQLQDEIRLLHRQVEETHRPSLVAPTPPPGRGFELPPRIVELLNQGQAFAVLVVAGRNLPNLAARYLPEAVASVRDAIEQRLRELFGRDAPIERLSERTFAVILDESQEKNVTLPSDTARHLSRDYAVTDRGKPLTLALQATAGVVYHRSGGDGQMLCQKLEQMMNARCDG